MGLIYKDRVQETTTTTGTGTLTLAGAVSGFQAFTAIGNSNTCIYCIEDANGAWEVGVGTYTSSGTTLARTTVLASSNSGSAITLSAGTHKVYVTADASALQQTQLRVKAETVTTANITGEVGTQHVCTIAGLTDHRDFVLPAVCSVGDRVSVMVVDGDDTYALIIKPAAGDTINGGVADAEWSRLFLAGEGVTLRCVTANSAWIVENDLRIPTSAKIACATVQTITINTDTLVQNSTLVFDNANLADTGAYKLTARRSGTYLVEGFFSITAMVTAKRINFKIYKNGVSEATALTIFVSATGTATVQGFFTMPGIAVGDYIQMYGWHEKTTSGDTGTTVNRPILSVLEVF